MWDTWYSDLNGVLVVAEITSNHADFHDADLTQAALALDDKSNYSKTSQVVGVSHAYVCPKRNLVWLEGIRINSRYRRVGIASELIDRMIEYGREMDSNIREAAAITAETNTASRLMLEKNKFQKRAKWTYYTGYKENGHRTNKEGLRTRKNIFKNTQGKVPNDDTNTCRRNMDVSFASISDIKEIIAFLSKSETFVSSGRRYVHSWKWYELNLENSKISELIASRKIIIGRSKGCQGIGGLAIINYHLRESCRADQLQRGDQERKQITKEVDDSGYNDDDDNTSFQVVYLDAPTSGSLEALLVFIVNWVISSSKFDRIQFFIPNQVHDENSEYYEISDVFAKIDIAISERFLLYIRSI